jgi:proteasome-associated ATPase
LIDPAILRPGRIDRKIKVNRPNKQGMREIYRIYLTDDLPYDGVLAKEAGHLGEAIERLIERFVEWQTAHREENKFLEVTLRSGRKETLYRSDLTSGAIIASIVERAKAIAIKRAIADQERGDSPSAAGISEKDLQTAFNAEYIENDIFPPSDVTEDWLKLVDYDPENVVKIAPVRPANAAKTRSGSGVI